MIPHDPALSNPRRRHTRIPPAVATCVGQPRHRRSSRVPTHLAPPPPLMSSLSSAGASPSTLMSGSCTTCCWFPTSWDSRPLRLRAPGHRRQGFGCSMLRASSTANQHGLEDHLR
ncbi:hypothetical protein SETIT_5G261500v2 [Setaria italica]|uniref:Uncharacterized protein n=2 Tax=Setaria italica TaxID=4555 RepID=A0A368R930_SETIT|nr:hypothetical protein SETIT_5G261500v2 [Setaria italica]